MRATSRVLWLLAVTAALPASATLSGHRWFNVPSYEVYAHQAIHNIPSGYATTVLPVVQASFRHWTLKEVECTSWDSSYVGTFTAPAGRAAKDGSDKVNHVLWLGGANWAYTANTLAMTTTSYYTGSGEIFDADMEVNDNVPWATAPSTTAYDVETVVTHEAGHFLGLDHTTGQNSVMNPTISVGQIKRQLLTVDLSEVCTLYPSGNQGGGQLGSPCTANSDCASGLGCRGAPGASAFICAPDCGAGCPAGTSCQQAKTPAGTTVTACLVAPGTPDLCHFCTAGQDCLSGTCVTTGRQNFCTTTCTDAAQCGAGYTCVDNFCAPEGETCPEAQCTSASQCPQGYACEGGMCTATGQVGDRCDVSRYCGSCSTCVGDWSEAYCRACCGGTGKGGSCDACPSGGCSGACADLQDTNGNALPDSVCVPEGLESCTPCNSTEECMPGLACVAGRCHAACNAGTSNTCDAQACGPVVGSATGACACPTEIAYAGQACGTVSGQLRICGGGAACVGTPGTCRFPCGSGGACGAGEACQVVGGRQVCVPVNTVGHSCGACNADGTCSEPGMFCVGGRCHAACDPASPSCDACVDVGSSGVCACPDEQNLEGGACGVVNGVGLACANHGVCLEQACRYPCDVGDTCVGTARCTETPEGKLCLPQPGGCGCTSTSPEGLLAALLPLGAWARLLRRRAA